MPDVTLHHASGVGVAERWRNSYTRDGQWRDFGDGRRENMHKRLCSLGPEPAPAEVAEIIGNKSWSYLHCSGCDECVELTISMGFCDSEYCEGCVSAMAQAFRDKSTETQ
ncbi:MAG: hypothetical protein V4564_07670 [Pseudomonadota bacterium]